MRLSGMDIQKATRGHWHGAVPAAVHGIATDSRAFTSGQAFLALRGPHFDGHRFAIDIADRASALIGDHEGIRLWQRLDVSQLEVDDTLQALGDIAHAWRNRLRNTSVVAISGSYGKTSLRSLLEHGLARLGMRIAATRANLNNLIGVPQTLLAVPEEAEVAIIECGISETGEMERLAQIVEPDIAVLTGLSDAHGEGLGGIDGVAREKAHLFGHLRPGGWCMLGEGVAGMLHDRHIPLPDPTFTMDEDDAVGWQLDGNRLRLHHGRQSATMDLPLPARHWGANIALAATIMLRLTGQHRSHASFRDMVAALDGWRPEAGRMRMIAGRNGSRILDDSYNANPVSMQAAIDTLAALPGHRVAILGDMAELGESSATAHAALRLDDIDDIYLIGRQMCALAGRYPRSRCFPDTDAACAYFDSYLPPRDATILIKASRGMALERIVGLLQTQTTEAGHAL